MTTSAKKGNSFVVKIATTFNGATYQQLGALRTTGLTLNKTTVDITNKDSTGWQELLPGGGVKSISISGEGVYTDHTSQAFLIDAWEASTHWNFELVDEVGDTFTGAFHVDSIDFGGDSDAEHNFSLSLSSADVIVHAEV